jgi:CBS domain-containing protein
MLSVEKIMQSDPTTVSPDMTLVNLERLFLSTGFTGFPVVKEDRLIGVISRSDIIRSLATERSRAEQLSDFYCGAQVLCTENACQSLEATAAQVGVRLAEQCVEDAMVGNVVSIDSSESLQHLAQIMFDGHLHRLPVVNGEKLVGLITTMDLVRAISEGHLTETDEATDPQVLLA